MEAPPYTRVIPLVASNRPTAEAASAYSGRAPGLEPQKTQTRWSGMAVYNK